MKTDVCRRFMCVAAALCLLAIGGCAVPRLMNKPDKDPWVGKKISDMVVVLGTPEAVRVDMFNRKIITYRKRTEELVDVPESIITDSFGNTHVQEARARRKYIWELWDYVVAPNGTIMSSQLGKRWERWVD